MSKSEISQKPVAEKLKILPKGRQVLEIEVDDELLELLKEVEQLDSHLGYQPKAEHIKRVLKFYLSKKHPCHKKELSREKAQRHSERSEESSNKPQNPRYISKKRRQVVWQQHGGMCAATDPTTGKRCESKFRLQIEHIIPVAYGGTANLDNLTLYCQAHNILAARKAGLFHPNQQKELFN